MPVILFDGDCGLCNRLVRFVHKRDRHGRYQYARLGGPTARTLLRQHGLPDDLHDTIVLVQATGALTRSDAALAILRELDGAPWRAIAHLAGLAPRSLRDAAYDLVAQNRHRLFHDRACRAPEPALRERMLP